MARCPSCSQSPHDEREGMEPDDLLCSRNARPPKGGIGSLPGYPSCSQNAHDKTVLVRCAQ